MGYKCTFMDNEVYYAQDVNAMLSNITTGGVVLRDSGNLLSDLNDATRQMVTEGVTSFADSCKLTVSDGIYKIGEGVCFMHDGSAITFDKNGYEITPLSGVKSHVYIKRNYTENTIEIVVSDSELDGDVVKIAEIDENGTIYDKRQYARAKVLLSQGSGVKKFQMSFPVNGERVKTIDVGTGDFSRIIANSLRVYNNGTLFLTRTPNEHNSYKIVDDTTLVFNMGRYINDSSTQPVYFTKSGQYLEIEIYDGYNGYLFELDFEVV